jgi:hypothetical protein
VTGRERAAVARFLRTVEGAIMLDRLPVAEHYQAVGYVGAMLSSMARELEVPGTDVARLADSRREWTERYVAKLAGEAVA